MRHIILLVLVTLVYLVAWALTTLGCTNAHGAPLMPSANSHYTYLQKVRNGTVFQETFENNSFLTADGWTTLQGNPANSINQALPGSGGIASWDNTAVVPGTTTQSLPVAKKVITDTNVDQLWLVQGWFYDTSDTTSPGPYLKVKLSNGIYASIGVRNSVSTTYYSYSGTPTSGTDAPDTAFTSLTGVARSVGWHYFTIIPANNQIYIQVDNTVHFVNATLPLGTPLSELYLCADKIGGPGPSFGYFDQVGYYRSTGFFVGYNSNLVSGSMRLYDSSNNYLQSTLGYLNPIFFAPTWYEAVYPFACFIEAAPASNNSNLIYRSCLLQVNPGDIYQLNDLNFGRKFESIDQVDTGLNSRSQTNSGVQEVLNYGLKDKWITTIKELTDPPWKKQIDNLFLYANTGGPFSVMYDDTMTNAFGVVSAFVQGGTSATVTIMANLSTNSTDAFVVGNDYVIRNQGNTQKQEVTLLSKTITQLTFDQNLNFDVNAPDGNGNYYFVYSKYFLPFMELGEDNLNGLKLSSAQLIYYNWIQNIQEYNS